MLYLYLADWSSFFRLCKMAPKSDIIVLVATFFLTVFFDLVVAIEIGVVLAALLFMKRMAETADIKAWKYTDSPDITPGEVEKLRDIPHSISVFEICGPMFFAAADQILNINSNHHTKVVVIRMRSVPAIDASAMRSLHELANRAKRKNITLVFSHVNEQPMQRDGKRWFYWISWKRKFPSQYCGCTGLCRSTGKIKLRTKNVPWHILAPAAVACDIYLIRRSAHPRGAFYTLQESNFL